MSIYGHNFVTDLPIDVMFGTRVGFLGSSHLMVQLPNVKNPTWWLTLYGWYRWCVPSGLHTRTAVARCVSWVFLYCIAEYFLSPAKLSGPFSPFTYRRGSSARSDLPWFGAWLQYRPAVHGDWDDEILAANENLYSSKTVDTKEKQNNVRGFKRGWKEMPRNSLGVEKIVSRVS